MIECYSYLEEFHVSREFSLSRYLGKSSWCLFSPFWLVEEVLCQHEHLMGQVLGGFSACSSRNHLQLRLLYVIYDLQDLLILFLFVDVDALLMPLVLLILIL